MLNYKPLQGKHCSHPGISLGPHGSSIGPGHRVLQGGAYSPVLSLWNWTVYL